MNITKAVIPVAGLGTRFLPATKAMPKEMLPVVDKPAIQYVVEEALAAELPHILMVTGRNKSALENHFDRAVELEQVLVARGDAERLQAITSTTEMADIHYVRQRDPLGLGHAVLKARSFVGDEPFAVMLGDDIIDESEALLREMKTIASERGASVVALMEVPWSDVSKYGVASVAPSENEGEVQVNGFIEKPRAEIAPSNLVIIGRYVLQPQVFDILETLTPSTGGEIQLTDALDTMARNPEIGGPVVGLIFKGRRFDTGDRLSYLKAIVEIGSGRKDLGPEFSSWLISYADSIQNQRSRTLA